MLSQKQNVLNFPALTQQQKSIIFNLGGLTEEEKKLIGCLLTVHIEQAFLHRATLPEHERSRYFVLIDEFPTFAEQSGEAFNHIMEQLRKYKCSLLLVNQHLEQLPRGIAGALQNATPIMMRTGYRDSNTLASYFYRKEEEVEQDFFTRFLFPQEKDAFIDIEHVSLARKKFETLERQEALITLHGQTQHIKFPTLPPVRLPSGAIEQIKQTYEQRLLTPLSAFYADRPSPLVRSGTPVPGTIAKRRVPRSSSPPIPLQTFVGAAGTDEQLQAIFSRYGYLTVAMVAKLLGKSENTARNKLNKLVDAGVLQTQNVPRTTPSGKTPFVYTLVKKGARKHEFLEHALATSDILMNAALLPTVAGGLTIVDMQSDFTLKASPLKLADGTLLVPDGYVRLFSQAHEYVLYFEIDRNTEFQKEKITSKLKNYQTLASHCECMAVAFCVVEGGDLRVKTLRNWAADVLPNAYRALFLFAHIDLPTISPDKLFLTPLWSLVGETALHPLIEM